MINYSPGPPKTSDAKSFTIKRNVQAGKPIQVNVKSWHPRRGELALGSYQVGDHITDPAAVVKASAEHPEYVVRKFLEESAPSITPSPTTHASAATPSASMDRW